MISPILVHGVRALTLENRHLRAVIVPELGGRIWELEDRVRSRQWIWHRDGVPLAAPAPGAAYDDVWAGGWEELFPNDAPGVFEGRSLPDHGEWWTAAWDVGPSTDPAHHVRLSTTTHSVRTTCTKDIVLAPDAATLTITYRIRSHEPAPFHFLFKQHLPVGLSPDCRLRLPGGDVHPVDPNFSTVMTGTVSPWPRVTGRDGGVVDLQEVPAPSPSLREFIYVRDLPAGWCGVDDLAARASLRLAFDVRDYPYTWLFLSYGGWRDVYTAVLEPCSNMPKDLTEALRLGQSARLSPGEEFVTTVAVSLGGLPA